MKTRAKRAMLVGAVGPFKPAAIWCFEPVCEGGRTLLLAQRSVAFRLWAAEHEKECLKFLLRVHCPAAERHYADTIFPRLRD